MTLTPPDCDFFGLSQPLGGLCANLALASDDVSVTGWFKASCERSSILLVQLVRRQRDEYECACHPTLT